MYTEGHEGRSRGVAAITKDAVSADRRACNHAGANHVGPLLDMPRRIAQERVPTASDVGSRDVTWVSQPTPLSPFASFRVFRGPWV